MIEMLPFSVAVFFLHPFLLATAVSPHIQQSSASTVAPRTTAPEGSSEIIAAVPGFYELLSVSEKQKTDWDFVTISRIDGVTLRWQTRGGVEWTLKLRKVTGTNDYDPGVLAVQPDCPFFVSGHTTVSVEYGSGGMVRQILGPGDEPYTPLSNSAAYLAHALVGRYKNENGGVAAIIAHPRSSALQWEVAGRSPIGIALMPSDGEYDRDCFRLLSNPQYAQIDGVCQKVVWNEPHSEIVSVEGPSGEPFTRVK